MIYISSLWVLVLSFVILDWTDEALCFFHTIKNKRVLYKMPAVRARPIPGSGITKCQSRVTCPVVSKSIRSTTPSSSWLMHGILISGTGVRPLWLLLSRAARIHSSPLFLARNFWKFQGTQLVPTVTSPPHPILEMNHTYASGESVACPRSYPSAKMDLELQDGLLIPDSRYCFLTWRQQGGCPCSDKLCHSSCVLCLNGHCVDTGEKVPFSRNTFQIIDFYAGRNLGIYQGQAPQLQRKTQTQKG